MWARCNSPASLHLWYNVSTGSIAFAREALLLSVALQEQRVACEGGAMLV